MTIHPPKYSNKYFYETDNFFEYEIGRVLEYLTYKMMSYGVNFETYQLNQYSNDKNGNYRPHNKIFPYCNDIIYMYSNGKYGYSIDCYKLGFYPSHKISDEQAKKITSLFCNQDNYKKINQHGDIEDVKDWVDYLTFQTPIRDNVEPYSNGEIGGRIIVQLFLNKFVAERRKEKIKTLIKCL